MPFVHTTILKMETPQLLREYRSASIHIAALNYDLRLHIYLGHPKTIKEIIADEIDEYASYLKPIEEELNKRGLEPLI